jgi:hypothetical protein
MDNQGKTANVARRVFLNRSMMMVAGTIAASGIGTASQQTPAAQSVVNLSTEKVIQFSLVVKDVEKVAKRFSEVFGVSWRFYDLRPEQIILHDKAFEDIRCYLKAAIGNIGGRSFKLLQPVSGQSSYAEFLQKNGEGFYTIGLGTLATHDQIVTALAKATIGVEMQGDWGNGSKFTILETAEDIGCRIEFSSPANKVSEPNLRQTGVFAPTGTSIIDMDRPIFSGGRKFNQVGIVLKDEKKATKRFEELFGIPEWRYSSGPPGLTDAFLNEAPVPKSAMHSLDVDFANGWLGDIQIELIKPLGIKPGGCHQQFLDKHGNGIQHISFGRQPDYDTIVDAMKRAGISREFSASLVRAGGTGDVSASYFATQDKMGGFQLEIVGRK